MRTRIGTTIAVVAATLGIAAGVAGPVYAAFGGSSTTGTVTEAGRIARVITP